MTVLKVDPRRSSNLACSIINTVKSSGGDSDDTVHVDIVLHQNIENAGDIKPPERASFKNDTAFSYLIRTITSGKRIPAGINFGIQGLSYPLTLFEDCSGSTGNKIVIGLAVLASAAGAEGLDGLARKVSALKECIDDPRSCSPPEREAEVNLIVLINIFACLGHRHTALLVSHLDVASAVSVLPVKIGTRVRYFRSDNKKVSTLSLSYLFSFLGSYARCSEICYKLHIGLHKDKIYLLIIA